MRSSQVGYYLPSLTYKSDSIRISDLAARLGMDRTTLTRNLAILEREGFINISEGKDHREM
jgi:DNA-binding MarR family transcriptional regulator